MVVDDEVRGDGNQITWGLVDHGRILVLQFSSVQSLSHVRLFATP